MNAQLELLSKRDGIVEPRDRSGMATAMATARSRTIKAASRPSVTESHRVTHAGADPHSSDPSRVAQCLPQSAWCVIRSREDTHEPCLMSGRAELRSMGPSAEGGT